MNKNKTIYEIHNDLINKKYSIVDYVQNTINIINKCKDQKDNVFLLTYFEKALKQATYLDQNINENKNNLLYGIISTLKDNINVKDSIVTCGSLFLENYKSPYNASIVNNLENSNSTIIGKVNLDEFGFGGTGLLSGFGWIKNPIDTKRIVGGSSSGGAVAVYNNTCAFSIGTDTGDSVRTPAHFLGLVGFKPSYGIISRYGVIPYASSLDHVGIIANDVRDISIVMDAIGKYDANDYTSINLTCDFYKHLKTLNKPKILVFDNIFDLVSDNLKNEYIKFINKLSYKYEIIHKNFDLSLYKIIPSIYKTIANVEGVSNMSNMNGILFGNRKDIDYKNYEELMIKIRTKHFGKELKKRMILGSYLSNEENFEKIFMKAHKIRNIIVNYTNELLQDVDGILLPGGSNVAPLIEDVQNGTITLDGVERMLQIANFGGLPSITLPLGNKDNLPFGINLTSKKYDDINLINLAYTLEQFINKKD